jgi:hypothetical protein
MVGGYYQPPAKFLSAIRNLLAKMADFGKVANIRWEMLQWNSGLSVFGINSHLQ